MWLLKHCCTQASSHSAFFTFCNQVAYTHFSSYPAYWNVFREQRGTEGTFLFITVCVQSNLIIKPVYANSTDGFLICRFHFRFHSWLVRVEFWALCFHLKKKTYLDLHLTNINLNIYIDPSWASRTWLWKGKTPWGNKRQKPEDPNSKGNPASSGWHWVVQF